MPIKENVEELRDRVFSCTERLKEMKVRSARFCFVLKYPEYDQKDDVSKNRFDNLWYGKSTDEDFTKKLESFTKYKETEFK